MRASNRNLTLLLLFVLSTLLANSLNACDSQYYTSTYSTPLALPNGTITTINLGYTSPYYCNTGCSYSSTCPTPSYKSSYSSSCYSPPPPTVNRGTSISGIAFPQIATGPRNENYFSSSSCNYSYPSNNYTHSSPPGQMMRSTPSYSAPSYAPAPAPAAPAYTPPAPTVYRPAPIDPSANQNVYRGGNGYYAAPQPNSYNAPPVAPSYNNNDNTTTVAPQGRTANANQDVPGTLSVPAHFQVTPPSPRSSSTNTDFSRRRPSPAKQDAQDTQNTPNQQDAPASADQPKPKGNNGLGNGTDPQPPGNPKVNDAPGATPGNPGNTAKPATNDNQPDKPASLTGQSLGHRR